MLGRNQFQLHVRKNFPSSQVIWWCDRSFPKMVSSLLLSTSNQKPDKLLSGIISDLLRREVVKLTTSKFLKVWSHDFIPRYMALEQSFSLDLFLCHGITWPLKFLPDHLPTQKFSVLKDRHRRQHCWAPDRFLATLSGVLLSQGTWELWS